MGMRRLPLIGLTAVAGSGLLALPAAAQITITTGSTEVTSPIATTGGTAAVTLSGQGATLVNRSSLSSAGQAVIGSGSFTGETVNNFGSITTTSSSAAALLFTTGTSQSVTNNAGASITGASGISFVGGSSGAVTVVNAGTITATGGSSGNGISLFNSGGTITNSGTITATGNALSTFTNANLAQIVNSGTLTSTGTGTAALSLNGASSTTNSGAIMGATGISLQASSIGGIGHTITNMAAGTITGTTAAIDNQSGAPLTLINAGTITGAIKLGSAGDSVSITGGRIAGDITGRNVAGESVQFALGTNGSFTTGGSITGVNSVAVQSGTLTIANPITGGGSIAIASGATAILGSSLGATSISNAGTLQLSGSQIVTGSYSQTGTLGVTLSDAGRVSVGSTTLNVAGTAQLTGAKIAVTIDPVNTKLITANQQFTVLTATSGLTVSGTPTVTSSNNAFVFTAGQVGNSEVVTAVVDTVDSPLAKLSRSGGAAAGVAGSLLTILKGGFSVSDDLSRAINVLVTLPSNQLTAALNNLSPNTGANTGAGLGTISVVSGGNTTVSTRLQQARAPGGDQLASAGPQYWVQGFGGTLSQGVRDGFAGFTADSYGMMLGGDRAVGDSLRLGLAGGVTRVDVSADSSRAGDTAAVDGYLVNLYGSWSPGSYYLDGMVMAGINDNATQRRIPLFGLTAKGQYDSYQTGFRVNAGLPQRLAGFTVTPNAFAQYTFLTRDGYTETRAGGLGLRTRGQDTNAAQLGVGVRIQHPFAVERGTAVPELRVNYIRELGDDRVPLTAAFVGGGSAFVTQGPSIPRDNLNIGAGATFYELRDLSVSLNYDYLTNDAYSAHTGTIRLRAAF